MNRQSVASSNVHSVGYDQTALVLEVQFRSGDIYQYYAVPQQVFIAFMASPSKGRYLHKNIAGHYVFRKIG